MHWTSCSQYPAISSAGCIIILLGKQRIASWMLVPCCSASFPLSFSGSKFENNHVLGKLSFSFLAPHRIGNVDTPSSESLPLLNTLTWPILDSLPKANHLNRPLSIWVSLKIGYLNFIVHQEVSYFKWRNRLWESTWLYLVAHPT